MSTFLRRATLALLVTFVLSSCSSSGESHASRSSTTVPNSIAVPPGSSPQTSPRVALTRLLQAETRNDHEASFRLVLHRADQPYPTVSRWSRYRQGLPGITGFKVLAGAGAQAVAVVDHKPGLDPFVGLSPAHDHETWRATRAGSGWLLYQQPKFVFDLPADSAAAQAARAWVAAVQRCDRKAAAALQAVTTLFDSTSTTPTLCHAAGTVKTGATGALAPGPASGDIVAQYTANALHWARVVQIETPMRFAVVLAPIARTWKVLGISDHS